MTPTTESVPGLGHERLRAVIDRVASRNAMPSSSESKRLSAAVRELSARYNDERGAEVSTNSALLHAARLHFSLVRDIPKSFAAAFELRLARLLPRTGELRLLDLGAGLGATSLGLLYAAAALGFRGRARLTLIDPDARALALAAELVVELAPEGIAVELTRHTATLERVIGASSPLSSSATFDLVALGQVLSEDARGLTAEARAEHHAQMLERLLHVRVAPSGSLLVVEPALRVRARHLHRVRDRLNERFADVCEAAYRPSVFAPCPHREPCGALAREGDWCHEDRAIDLPAWLIPVARGAGLRFQGLTFSFLVLRRDGRSVASEFAPGRTLSRVVSGMRKMKGKSEVFVCSVGGRLDKLECLDRDAKKPHGAPWRTLAHGDLIHLGAPAALARAFDGKTHLTVLTSVREGRV